MQLRVHKQVIAVEISVCLVPSKMADASFCKYKNI